MIVFRGIPIAVIVCFLYLVGMELAKRYIPNKEWHDFIDYITMGIGLGYGCVAAWFFNINFYSSIQIILGILASDNIFKIINGLVPKRVDGFERNSVD